MIGDDWFFDRNGEPITQARWGELRERESYRRVASTDIGDLWVSTVWIGMDVGVSALSGGAPEIFETMVFKPGAGADLEAIDAYTRRYASEQAANTGHDETVTLLLLDAGLPS